MRRKNDVWRIVNRRRKRRKGINEIIEEEEWKEHFMRLLGGVENKVRKGEGKDRRYKEKEISVEEVREAINKLKDEKAAGIDGIPGEVWKYGGEDM